MDLPTVERLSSAGYSAPEIEELANFLVKDFCQAGREALINLFLAAKNSVVKISTGNLVKLLEGRYKIYWQYQEPEKRGDPDTGYGAEGLRTTYRLLKIQVPNFSESSDIKDATLSV